jgi:acetyltransferase-like isoleucine patch superfamily enzyme
MIKKSIRKFLGKIYLVGKIEADKFLREHQMKELSDKISFDNTANITTEASIVNYTNDKSSIKIGANSLIRGELVAFNLGGRIEVGDNCFIGPGTRIWSAKKISIGNRVLISHNINIHDNNSHPLDSKMRHEDFMYMIENNGLLKTSDLNEKEIIIEDDVWIGFNSVILKGIKIKRGAIIGANTIVTEDVPEYAVVIGNPARIIKYAK